MPTETKSEMIARWQTMTAADLRAEWSSRWQTCRDRYDNLTDEQRDAIPVVG